MIRMCFPCPDSDYYDIDVEMACYLVPIEFANRVLLVL